MHSYLFHTIREELTSPFLDNNIVPLAYKPDFRFLYFSDITYTLKNIGIKFTVDITVTEGVNTEWYTENKFNNFKKRWLVQYFSYWLEISRIVFSR